jgi:hypothetical protein
MALSFGYPILKFVPPCERRHIWHRRCDGFAGVDLPGAPDPEGTKWGVRSIPTNPQKLPPGCDWMRSRPSTLQVTSRRHSAPSCSTINRPTVGCTVASSRRGSRTPLAFCTSSAPIASGAPRLTGSSRTFTSKTRWSSQNYSGGLHGNRVITAFSRNLLITSRVWSDSNSRPSGS